MCVRITVCVCVQVRMCVYARPCVIHDCVCIWMQVTGYMHAYNAKYEFLTLCWYEPMSKGSCFPVLVVILHYLALSWHDLWLPK